MDKWQPIHTAPPGEWLLLWWIPVDGNLFAESVIKGQISTDGKTYWDGSYRGNNYEEGYKPIERITHWMLPPERPEDRPPFDPAFAAYLKERREGLMHFAKWRASHPANEG